MDSKVRNWILLSLPTLGLAVFLIVRVAFLRESGLKGPADPSRVRFNLGSSNDLAAWQTGQFSPVSAPQTEGVIKAAVTNTGLSPTESQELESTIVDFLQAYEKGTFDSYFEFKTRGRKSRVEFTKRGEGVVRALLKVRPNLPPLPDEPKAKLEKVWEIITSSTTNRDFPTYDGNSPRLTQLEPASLKILIGTNEDAGVWVSQQSQQESPLKVGFAQNAFIQYDETPQSIQGSQGTLISAMLTANARYSRSRTASRFYAVFYWSEKSKKWYPSDLASYFPANFNTLF
jgi:hypothetical protein